MNSEITSKGEATRARIVDAAHQLFMEQGYHGTSMRQIVDRAGITMGGIYNHFASKEKIWEAVFMEKHPYREIIPLLQSAEGDTIAEFLSNAAKRLVNELGQQTDLLNLMFIELLEFKGEHLSELLSAVRPELARMAQFLAQKRGKLRPLAMPVLARSFAGLFFSYYITERLMPEELRVMMGPDALNSFVNIYLYGILDGSTEACDD
jgi:AcrR family transcriptional regulator